MRAARAAERCGGILALVLLIAVELALTAPATGAAGSPVDDLLDAGRYIEIQKRDDPHALAAWAFARYFLAPDRTAVEAARKAHEEGELLGTFVLMRACSEGMAVRYSEKLMYEAR